MVWRLNLTKCLSKIWFLWPIFTRVCLHKLWLLAGTKPSLFLGFWSWHHHHHNHDHYHDHNHYYHLARFRNIKAREKRIKDWAKQNKISKGSHNRNYTGNTIGMITMTTMMMTTMRQNRKGCIPRYTTHPGGIKVHFRSDWFNFWLFVHINIRCTSV